MSTYAHVCGGAHAHVCMHMWRKEDYLRHGSLTDLEVTKSPRLTGHGTPPTLLLVLPAPNLNRCRDYNDTLPHPSMFFKHGFGVLSLGPHARKTSSFLSELSPPAQHEHSFIPIFHTRKLRLSRINRLFMVTPCKR